MTNGHDRLYISPARLRSWHQWWCHRRQSAPGAGLARGHLEPRKTRVEAHRIASWRVGRCGAVRRNCRRCDGIADRANLWTLAPRTLLDRCPGGGARRRSPRIRPKTGGAISELRPATTEPTQDLASLTVANDLNSRKRARQRGDLLREQLPAIMFVIATAVVAKRSAGNAAIAMQRRERGERKIVIGRYHAAAHPTAPPASAVGGIRSGVRQTAQGDDSDLAAGT
jgi:hypothetical protein